MRFKVGDRVRIKSLEWYNVQCMDDNYAVIDFMNRDWCGYEMTIIEADEDFYHMKEDSGSNYWTDEMIEGLVEDGKEETIVDYVKESNDRYRIVVDNRFDIEVDEGEYYAVRRKKEYPKTYKECCKILEIDNSVYLTSDEEGHWNDYELGLNYLIEHLRKLIICRDAYWKIAGEEMALGESWEPDWDNLSTNHEFIKINKGCFTYSSRVLVFPTVEMRDTFYENFKEEIENCKELL